MFNKQQLSINLSHWWLQHVSSLTSHRVPLWHYKEQIYRCWCNITWQLC